MDNQNSNQSDRWIDDRLASLSPPANWQPHADRAFDRLMQRQGKPQNARWMRLSMAGIAFGSVAVIVVMLPWKALRTETVVPPANKSIPVEVRQEHAPVFSAQINVAPSIGSRFVMAKPSEPVEPLIFKPIPPLPELRAAEPELSPQTDNKKIGQTSRGVLAEAAGQPQESSQSGVTQPSVISKIQPAYTEEARQAKIQGIVELVCTIHTDGSVTVDRVTRGLGYGLDESATAAVSQWTFKPAQKDGVDVSTVVTIVVNFTLKK